MLGTPGPGQWSREISSDYKFNVAIITGMTPRAVDWGAASRGEAGGEGLRERKKRQLRQRLSDTATAMFLERGFDAVRVVEVAAACEVSEKTVYNYFPTKESLVLDRWETTRGSLRAALTDPGQSPVDAVLGILADELGALTGWLGEQPDRPAAAASVRRFGELIASTPALRAYQAAVLDELTATAAQALAAGPASARTSRSPRLPPSRCSGCGACTSGRWRSTWPGRTCRRSCGRPSPPRWSGQRG